METNIRKILRMNLINIKSLDHLKYIAMQESVLQFIILLNDTKRNEIQHSFGTPNLNGKTGKMWDPQYKHQKHPS